MYSKILVPLDGSDIAECVLPYVEAIAMGKYPSPPARLLHLVSQGRPKKKVVLEFIKWVLTDGQKFIPESGYINLTETKIAEELKKLESDE